MTFVPGARLGPYEILAPLGEGGMGEVYRARDPRFRREVALKVLPTDFAQDPERLKRFEHEARAAGALNHPNILTVHDLGTADGVPYLVTELLEGETLASGWRAGRSRCRRRSTGRRRSRAGWPPRTRRGSSTEISSPRTCS